MKKLLIAFLGLFLLFNLSCSRDEDSSNSSNSVVGSWYLYSVGANGTAVINGVSTPISNPGQVVSTCMQKSTLTFYENGTGSVTSWDDTSGSCTQIQNENFTYTYDSTSMVLTIKTSSKTDVTNVKSLTKTEMVGEDNVTNQEMSGIVFTGKITTIMKKK